MDNVRVGIIGVAVLQQQASTQHSKLGGVDVVAFCDLIEERATKAAAKFGTPDAKVFTDYRDLLKLDP